MHLILNTKQHEKENLIDYTNISKKESYVLKYHVGPDTLKKFIDNTEEYRNETDDIKKITQRVIIWDVDGIMFPEKQ